MSIVPRPSERHQVSRQKWKTVRKAMEDTGDGPVLRDPHNDGRCQRYPDSDLPVGPCLSRLVDLRTDADQLAADTAGAFRRALMTRSALMAGPRTGRRRQSDQKLGD